MKLNDHLYTIISRDNALKSYTVEFIPDSVIYQAHFPEQPVTPGVCIIQIAAELLSIHLQQDVELRSISNAKFLSVINPVETPRVTYVFKKIEKEENSTALKVSVAVEYNGITYTKLSLAFSKK